MGNRSSREEGDSAASGVSLSQDLQEDIVRDFSNKVVQEQWTEFRASVLGRRRERHARLLRTAQEAEAARALQEARAVERQRPLDAAIEGLNAAFADRLVAAAYDADRALARYGALAPEPSGDAASEGDAAVAAAAAARTSPCLGPRAHWMFCAQKYAQDPRPCDAYLAVLEKCVQGAVVGRVAPAAEANAVQ